MLRVTLVFEAKDQSVEAKGLIAEHPKEGSYFTFIQDPDKPSPLGLILNVEKYGEILLVRTDLLVFEVKIHSDNPTKANILPFRSVK